jgi:hypothetical protein
MTIRPASPGKEKEGTMHGGMLRFLKVVAVLAALAAMTTSALASTRSSGPATPNFNLEAVLRPVTGGPDNGFGLVKFRQPKDSDTIAYLGVWVRDLAPNHDYSLQRATDSIANDDCVGANWLTLGQGLAPKAITTDGRGTGRADLFRNLAGIPLGTEFDIRFRVIDTTTLAVVLASACYQFTVSQ